MVIHLAEDAVVCERCFKYEYSNDVTFAFACCGFARSFDFAPGWTDADFTEGCWKVAHAQEFGCARASRSRLLI
jgi:hypothetical protein